MFAFNVPEFITNFNTLVVTLIRSNSLLEVVFTVSGKVDAVGLDVNNVVGAIR